LRTARVVLRVSRSAPRDIAGRITAG
jgi:hypothetical protein